ESVLRDELEAIDRACSRFRSDSEIWRLYRDGRPVEASPLLYEAVSVACAVAELSGGAVDPTVGDAVEALGYDRDFAEVAAIGEPLVTRPVPAPGWWLIELNDQTRSIAVPGGIRLDLGASAKALVADRAARRIASMTNSGTLVCVGGDISVSGPAPHGGWPAGMAVACVDATPLSTAAVIWGESAPEPLAARGFPPRLVRYDGVEVGLSGSSRGSG